MTFGTAKRLDEIWLLSYDEATNTEVKPSQISDLMILPQRKWIEMRFSSKMKFNQQELVYLRDFFLKRRFLSQWIPDFFPTVKDSVARSRCGSGWLWDNPSYVYIYINNIDTDVYISIYTYIYNHNIYIHIYIYMYTYIWATKIQCEFCHWWFALFRSPFWIGHPSWTGRLEEDWWRKEAKHMIYAGSRSQWIGFHGIFFNQEKPLIFWENLWFPVKISPTKPIHWRRLFQILWHRLCTVQPA